MNATELRAHKQASKRLVSGFAFKSIKKNDLPKPLHKLSGSRIKSTELLTVSDSHKVVMYWRDGALRTDSAFYAHLFCELQNKKLYPLLEFHFHPSHKGVHAKLPCKTELDYSERHLVQAPELNLLTQSALDPRNEQDLKQLIATFCKACGISMDQEGDLWSA